MCLADRDGTAYVFYVQLLAGPCAKHIEKSRIGLQLVHLNMDVDTQAGVGQNKPLSGGVSYFPSSSAYERVGGGDRPIHT